MRAVAITLVVLGHTGAAFCAGGFVGVDVFFVLSGYLITGLLVREYRATGRMRFAAFYARRLKRLLPALMVMLALVVLAAPVLLTGHEVAEQLASLPYAATWTSNLFFAFGSMDYFADLRSRDLFLHTWSLGLEEQFYLAWPVLLLVPLWAASRRPGRRGAALALPAMVLLLFASSLALLWFWTQVHPLRAFYLMPARVWQFALGAAVAVFPAASGAGDGARLPWLRVPVWGALVTAVGLLLIGGSAVMLHPGVTYPGAWALLPSVGAVLVIASARLIGPSIGSRLLAHPVAVWVGDRSYSWYLWHWPVLMLGARWVSGADVLGNLGLCAFAFGLAALSYRWVELPFW